MIQINAPRKQYSALCDRKLDRNKLVRLEDRLGFTRTCIYYPAINVGMNMWFSFFKKNKNSKPD